LHFKTHNTNWFSKTLINLKYFWTQRIQVLMEVLCIIFCQENTLWFDLTKEFWLCFNSEFLETCECGHKSNSEKLRKSGKDAYHWIQFSHKGATTQLYHYVRCIVCSFLMLMQAKSGRGLHTFSSHLGQRAASSAAQNRCAGAASHTSHTLLMSLSRLQASSTPWFAPLEKLFQYQSPMSCIICH
jgi:hypothetical protein